MNHRTIEEVVSALGRIPAATFSRETVLREFGRARIDPHSLNGYLYFSPTHYTRNLIHHCELFEVIAICWEVGQDSVIHNHRGQECWMGVPIGRLEVRNYALVEHDPVTKTCRLRPSIRYVMDPDHPASVDPSEPIHSVHNLPEYRARAVSIHVYSRPFNSCEVYQPERGRYFDVPLDYTSRFGVLGPGEAAEAAAF